MKLEKILHKWQIGFSFEPHYAVWHKWSFRIWCVWLKYIPMPGSLISPKDYHGFIWEVSTPHATAHYVFKVPEILRKTRILPYHFYQIPIAWKF